MCFNDGVHPRFFAVAEADTIPQNYQLLFAFFDGSCLVFTAAMYGGLYVHDGTYDNDYYLKSRASFAPQSKLFCDSFYQQISNAKKSMSAKAFLETDQHFPGIGNGVIQDILFAERINPRQPVSEFDKESKDRLFCCTVQVLTDMASRGGRNTEVAIF